VLDDAPIIEQGVVRITHKDDVEDFVETRLGKSYAIAGRALACGKPHPARRQPHGDFRMKRGA